MLGTGHMTAQGKTERERKKKRKGKKSAAPGLVGLTSLGRERDINERHK